jgi:hypothetical protein
MSPIPVAGASRFQVFQPVQAAAALHELLHAPPRRQSRVRERRGDRAAQLGRVVPVARAQHAQQRPVGAAIGAPWEAERAVLAGEQASARGTHV